jgi:c-di-GMP-binding flagellar brake protein YcgR
MEQRLYPRIDLELPILYKVMGEEPSVLSAGLHPDLPATSGNISVKGVCMVLAERIAKGTVLGLSIHVAGERQKISALARVVWSRPTETPHHFLTGLSFISVYRKTSTDMEVMDVSALEKLFTPP